MTKEEEKDLILQDLCARLPYGVHIWTNDKKHLKLRSIDQDGINGYWANDVYEIDEVKPYLRPMSSMTEEEKKEYNMFFEEYAPDDRWPYLTKNFVEEDLVSELIDWFNKNMFDFRGLIPKDIALSTEIYNPYVEV